MTEPRIQLTYVEAKQRIIEALLRCAAEHDSGRLVALDTSIDRAFDDFDCALPREAGPEFDKVAIAFEFWAGWLDSSNHDWRFYDGIKSSDWPRLARLVVADLEADREIAEPLVLSQFGLKEQDKGPGLLERLKRLFSR